MAGILRTRGKRAGGARETNNVSQQSYSSRLSPIAANDDGQWYPHECRSPLGASRKLRHSKYSRRMESLPLPFGCDFNRAVLSRPFGSNSPGGSEHTVWPWDGFLLRYGRRRHRPDRLEAGSLGDVHQGRSPDTSSYRDVMHFGA